MSYSVDVQVIKTLKDFCDALLETDCGNDFDFTDNYEQLFVESNLAPLSELSDLFVHISTRWKDGTLTVNDLGALAQFYNRILK